MASYDDFPNEGFDGGAYPNVSYADLESIGDTNEPRILLMGPRRSGKSSIQRVVFHKMSPHETLFLEATNEVQIKEVNNNALVHFQILDFPGGFDFLESKTELDPTLVFNRGGAVVFVIDGQEDGNSYTDAAEYFLQVATTAYEINPKIRFFVLIHKVDGDSYLSEDHKIDCQREIQNQITDALADANLPIHPNFHLTSIYDHTIFEAFSKIVQKLIPQLAFLENLLDSLIMSCGIDKAFLFDVVSKVYVATDSNPVDMQTYELCSDMIDVVIDVSCIYSETGDVSDALSSNASSGAAIKLSTGYYLYLKEVNRYLALVCLMRDESFAKSGLVEYNVAQFKKAIADLFEAKHKSGAASGTA